SNTSTDLSMQRPSRVDELIAGYVLGDLDSAEQSELFAQLDETHRQTLFEVESSASAIAMSAPTPNSDTQAESLPSRLRQRILNDSPAFLPPSNRRNRVRPHSSLDEEPVVQRIVDDTAKTQQLESVSGVALPAASPSGTREAIAWLVAAAAILLAIVSYATRRPENPVDNVIAQSSEPTLIELRQTLIDQSANVVISDWTDGPTPFGDSVSGDVVWDNERQTGYMRFVGMPKNDATEEQYQLWIIDPDGDEHPIDGGVFDITSDGEIIVAIDAKLRVNNPAAFAITIERPGGVVVSKKDRLPLLASVAVNG
ncbi:MAG: anti-sigma factor, partial [Planctomycetota bacterium]